MREIDLHGMKVEEAKKYLTSQLNALPKGYPYIDVVHGYHGGTALREMVRNFNHPRIERKVLGMNQGTTTFILK